MSDFNPHDIGVKNGNIFGFPVSLEESNIAIIPIPWDLTASYRKGTSRAPQMILDASTQLDFYHPYCKEAHEIKVHMTDVSEDMQRINEEMNPASIEYMAFLEEGGELDKDSKQTLFLEAANEAHANITQALYAKSLELLEANKTPAVLGGEHSVPLGLLMALGEKYGSFGVLQIDAHADLRDRYEGFEQSHASIFHNVLDRVKQVEKLVQIGVRDVSAPEVDRIEKDDKIAAFFDWELKEERYKGVTWKDQVSKIISHLPSNIYISFDIDGLDPSLCPNTGTPVPGGFTLEEIRFLFKQITDSSREIIGFDLCEVGSSDEWDANVGARALWELVVSTHLTTRKK